MRVITERPLDEFAARYRDAARPLEAWLRITREAEWHSIADVRRVFPTADPVMVRSGRTVTVFNIGGNKYRLVSAIHYNRQRAYVLRVLTHAQYSAGAWKREL